MKNRIKNILKFGISSGIKAFLKNKDTHANSND